MLYTFGLIAALLLLPEPFVLVIRVGMKVVSLPA